MADLVAACQADQGAVRLTIGRLLDGFSLVLNLLALALLLLGEQSTPFQGLMLVIVVLGGIEKYYAIRVAFDHRIFVDWAARWQMPEGPSLESVLAGFDEALEQIGHRPAGGRRLRSLGERLAGACALLRRQYICLFLQTLLLLAAVLIKLLWAEAL